MKMNRGLWDRTKAFFKYYYLKIVRNDGSPEYIARGVALGLAVGMIIPMFFQLVIVIALAFLLRAAKVPAMAFTFVSNHFTVIVLYPLQCYVGSYLILRPFKFAELEHQLKELIQTPCWETFSGLGGNLVYSFFAGGALFALILAIPGYFITIRLVKVYRRKREERRKRKQENL